MTRGSIGFRAGRRGILLAFFLLMAALAAGKALAGTLTIPAGTTVIEEEAFYGDASLDEVILPEGLERIESRAFAGSSVTLLNLPSTLEYIAEDAFEGCENGLEIIGVEGNNYAWNWGRDHGYCRIYTALLIGEEGFSTVATRNRRDAENMAAMLGAVYTPSGTRYRVTKKIDLTRIEVRESIASAFGETEAQDVNLFFIATHGASTGDGDLSTMNGSISFDLLASWLNTYTKGRVIVILEACGSGSSILEGAETPEEAEAYLNRAIEAFAGADSHVDETQGGAVANSTGDLRVPNKYYVLAAAAHHELSWGYEDGYRNGVLYRLASNYFTKWLVEGIGAGSASAPADTNPADRVLTLRELYAYVQRYDTYAIRSGGVIYYQHVQAYPMDEGAAYPFFRHP